MAEFPEHLIKWFNKIDRENKLHIEMKNKKYVLYFNRKDKKLQPITQFIKLTKKHRRKY
jgi:hypothetical protein